ncbi:alkaline phosphatase [Pectinophora gossypiella]|uniref:alkaline phosphatase n=1 Tax=Pectinophora gossypiella TaxID=13191 RepID=UPI00214F5000|nr:alkaline phosphatase [Pectinophora gossypiella]
MWLFSVVLTLAVASQVVLCLQTDQEYWKRLAKEELEEALQVKWNLGTARNVILFVGDGMGPNTVTATRIYKGGESHRLAYEKFPHVGLLKTYSATKMVPDSASTATAMFTGVKVNQETIGVDATVQKTDCEASLRPEARLKSLAGFALEAGKSAGLVTTMRVTHATPSPIYAHTAHRSWECEAAMPAGSTCKDIARQMVEDWPGKDLQVIMGGGRQGLVSNATGTESDPLNAWGCLRQDGRNLIEDYKTDKRNRGLNSSVVSNNKELQDLDIENTDYLLGIFANGHLRYEHERDAGPEGSPSISQMTEAAIKVLRKNKKGFFLMVEGGNIDMAHHRGQAKKAINESAAMEDAVQVAMNLTDEKDTLIIVTSDHTHTLNINGYPLRGTNIFGIASVSPHDLLNYTTLSYSTGGPGSFHYYVTTENNETKVTRRDPSQEDIDSFDYEQIAAITLDENSHGGGDVAIYARGPYAHLFHNVHEQHYVFHAVSYAAKIGAYYNKSSSNVASTILCLVLLLYCIFS